MVNETQCHFLIAIGLLLNYSLHPHLVPDVLRSFLLLTMKAKLDHRPVGEAAECSSRF